MNRVALITYDKLFSPSFKVLKQLHNVSTIPKWVQVLTMERLKWILNESSIKYIYLKSVLKRRSCSASSQLLP